MTCVRCGQTHADDVSACQMVKAIEFHPDGVTIKRIEYLTPQDFPAAEKASDPETYERLRPSKE